VGKLDRALATMIDAVDDTRSLQAQGPRPNDGIIDKTALLSLAAQHFSVTWSQRTTEFASYIFLIDLFHTSLLPSALYGFFTTLAGVLFGGNVGALVDHPSRLKVIRINIAVAKLAVTSVYTFLLVLLIKYSEEARIAGQNIGHTGHRVVWILYFLVVLSSCVMKLSDIAMSVAIERDWVMTIAAGSDAHLTTLNLCLRRIDLGCKLIAPLFTALLTSTIGNTRTAFVLGGIALGGLGFELLWIDIVWKRFPILSAIHPREGQAQDTEANRTSSRFSFKTLTDWAKASYHDCGMFVRNPVFPSSLAISLLYLNTLSFDGSMISWLKTNTYSDGLISGMRGVAVCTGLAGTAMMPLLEKRIGLARAGSWSIWRVRFSTYPIHKSSLHAFHAGPKWYPSSQSWRPSTSGRTREKRHQHGIKVFSSVAWPFPG